MADFAFFTYYGTHLCNTNDTLNVRCATTVNSTMFQGYVGSYALEVWSLYAFHDSLLW